MKGLLTLKQLSTEKILEILDYSLKLKNGYSVTYPNKKVATLFYENSTRTHYSFQCALMNLGINVISCNVGQSSVQKGETLYDTVKTFESLGVDGVIINKIIEEKHMKDSIVKPLFKPLGYKLRGRAIDSNKSIVEIFNFRIDLEYDYPNGLGEDINNGDYVEFLVDRLDCIIENC